MKKYKVEPYDGKYNVFETVESVGELECEQISTIILGRTLFSNFRKPSTFKKKNVFYGSLSDCYAFIMLKEHNDVDF